MVCPHFDGEPQAADIGSQNATVLQSRTAHRCNIEIERGRGQMRGSIVLGLEDSGSRMTRIGKNELCYGDVLGVDELLHRVDAVTDDDVAGLAGELLHRPRCLTVVGPFGAHDFDGVV